MGSLSNLQKLKSQQFLFYLLPAHALIISAHQSFIFIILGHVCISTSEFIFKVYSAATEMKFLGPSRAYKHGCHCFLKLQDQERSFIFKENQLQQKRNF